MTGPETASARVGSARKRAAAGVMQQRHEPPDSLDFFPTPPWATRAFCEHVLFPVLSASRNDRVWEPCCGEGHMAEPLREYFPMVFASDVFSYGYGHVADVLAPKANAGSTEWIITNPPFNIALDVARAALEDARFGVSLLVRTQWLHSDERYRLFEAIPPTLIAYSVERIPMHRGRWEPKGSTTTDYCWVSWRFNVNRKLWNPLPPVWIPPGQRKALQRPDDIRRFAKPVDAPLLTEAAS